MAETAAGMRRPRSSPKPTSSSMLLKRELAEAETAAADATDAPDARVAELTEQITTLTGRTEKTEKDLAAAQIRAQGAERNLAHATAQAAKAETRAAVLESKINEARRRRRQPTRSSCKRVNASPPSTRGSVPATRPLQAVESRAAKLATELAELTAKHDSARGASSASSKRRSPRPATKPRPPNERADAASEASAATAKLGRGRGANATRFGKAAPARRRRIGDRRGEQGTRDAAGVRIADAETRISDAGKRADDAEKRASAADTMAKAMAKDVAEALRRAAEPTRGCARRAREIGEARAARRASGSEQCR